MSLTLNDVLSSLDADADNTVKTAAEQDTSTSGGVDTSALRKAIKEAEIELSKTANNTGVNAVDNLELMATKLAAAEENLLVKEAHTYGAAMADGFVTRLSMYDDSAAAEYVKTAQEQASAEAFAGGVINGYLQAQANGNVKTAADVEAGLSQFDPGLVKAAAEIISGFNNATGSNESVKTAQEDKTAEAFADGVINGFLEARASGNVKTAADVDAELSQFDPALVKAAAEIISGFSDAVEAGGGYEAGAEKTAAELDALAVDCYRRGFEDCDRLISSLQQ